MSSLAAFHVSWPARFLAGMCQAAKAFLESVQAGRAPTRQDTAQVESVRMGKALA